MLGQPGEFEGAATLDEQSPTPLYLQLQRLIQESVGAGKLKADEALPSERDLARQLGISRVTVRKAHRRSGRERHPRPALGLRHLHRAGDACRAGAVAPFELHRRHAGARPDARGAIVIDRSSGPSSPKESMALGLSPGEPVSRLQRLRLAGGMPMAIEHAVVPARFLPDPEVVDSSLYAALIARGHRAAARAAAPPCRASQRRAGEAPAR